ncbi:MAG: alpha-2-macroglobulin family protein [Oscillatoria sp. SIO1A7]|nr:alpha-2-macroglobulin family protein [Oscillatoria sp. SIO1A7]
MKRTVRTCVYFLLLLILAVGLAACGPPKVKQLPPVAPLATPGLPEWIEQISPTEKTDTLGQILIRFKDPVIPLESIDSPAQKEKLKKFEIYPELPGRFRFLTPRMVGFQADRALPKATRIQVTLKAGLEDLSNHRLEQDLAWTFNTELIQLGNLPSIKPYEHSEPEYINVEPTLNFTSNVELNLESLQDRVHLFADGTIEAIPVEVIPTKPRQANSAAEQFDSSRRQWNYTFKPQEKLNKATRYRVEFASGISPVRGNLKTETPFVSEVETYSPLAFEGMDLFGQPGAGGAYGRFVNGSPQLKFNNKLVAEDAIANISVSPPPKERPKLVRAYDDSKQVTLNPWALEPDTAYTITIGADTKDRFGQTLGKPVTVQYKTGDLAGEIWAPSDLNIFPADKDLELNLYAVNLPESKYRAAYRVVKPTDLVYNQYGSELIPGKPATWDSFPIAAETNKMAEIKVPLREKLGGKTGMLAYAIEGRTNRYIDQNKEKWRESIYYGMVQLTNLGVFAQWFPDSGIIRVNHLGDGSAVSSAAVEIYQLKLDAKNRPLPRPCATGKTNRAGTFTLNSRQMRRCTAKAGKAPELLAIARENQDWAYASTHSYSGAYGYGISSDWDSGQPVSRGTIFSDRELYQPGEKIALTGAAYYLQNGKLVSDAGSSYSVTLEDPDGNTTNLGDRLTNEFGTFSVELPLEKDKPLGYYYIRAQSKNNVSIEGEFRLAEFKPPNFKTELSLDKKLAFTEEEVKGVAQSNYLFGSPVSGGKVRYYAARSPDNSFAPPGWEKFSFGRRWYWPEEQPSVSSSVLQEEAMLSDSGSGSVTVKVDKDLPYPMTYRIDATVSDVSNLSVSASQYFTALPSNKLIGLQGKFVGDAGKNFAIEAIVTDPEGKAIAGEKVRLELQKMEYSSVTQVVEGSRTPRYQLEYKTVASKEIKSRRTPQRVFLKPSEAGSYRIRANFANNKNETTATDWQIWVTGNSPVRWGRRDTDKNRLEIKLDKESYRPGETATALIQSPYAEGELFFAVVRDKPLYQKVVKVKGGAPQIRFKVTPEMLPNAAVEAVLVRQGESLQDLEPGSLENLVQIGFAPFATSLDEKYLQVRVTPQKAELQPGMEQTLQLELKDAAGRPVRGQFTVMVVNEAVLQLTGYRPPDLVKTAYAKQSISTRFSDNRFEVVLSPLASPLEKGWGYGGGRSARSASTRVRSDFKPLAYYNGSLLSDAKGRAKVSFKLPDDLTTWRVMAVAATKDMRFGNGDSTFIAKKALMANPLLPQFARPGDRFSAGVAATNTTGRTGNLVINGALSPNLQFTETSATTQSQKAKAESGTRAYRFPIVAKNSGEARVRFVTRLNNRQSDAFEVPLPVKELPVTESAVESGTTESQAAIPLNVANNIVSDAGGVEIALASTLVPEIAAPARRVFEENQLPFLEPMASELAIAANLQILGEKYGQAFADFAPEQQAALALEKLQELQLEDGGFASWPGRRKSSPFLTPYAAESLAKAREAGLPVDAATIDKVRDYLQKILANPSDSYYCNLKPCQNRVRLLALMALAELGETRNDFLADIYADRAELDRVSQIKLATYLFRFPEWQREAQAMWSDIQETVYETGRSASINLPSGWSWLSTPETAQARALRLAIARKAKPEISDRLLQGLLNMRRNGTWQNSYANAEALGALVEYAKLQPTPPDFIAKVELNYDLIDAMEFKGYENVSRFINVTIDRLPEGKSNLVLSKSGNGTLHYLVEYAYRLEGNQPGRFNGLRVERAIRKAGDRDLLAKIGLSRPERSLEVEAGEVFDIGLEIVTDHPVDNAIVVDPLPPGFEAVDTSFKTSNQSVRAEADSWQISYQTIYKDRVVAYGDRLPAGVYHLHYLVRSVTPGVYEWPGAEVYLQYAPEEFGRSASSTLEVKE